MIKLKAKFVPGNKVYCNGVELWIASVKIETANALLLPLPGRVRENKTTYSCRDSGHRYYEINEKFLSRNKK